MRSAIALYITVFLLIPKITPLAAVLVAQLTTIAGIYATAIVNIYRRGCYHRNTLNIYHNNRRFNILFFHIIVSIIIQQYSIISLYKNQLSVHNVKTGSR